MPLIVIIFKKNEDFFTCFSKIETLAQVSSFQQMTHYNSSIWFVQTTSGVSIPTEKTGNDTTFGELLAKQVNTQFYNQYNSYENSHRVSLNSNIPIDKSDENY
jgi:hypothetical protein